MFIYQTKLINLTGGEKMEEIEGCVGIPTIGEKFPKIEVQTTSGKRIRNFKKKE